MRDNFAPDFAAALFEHSVDAVLVTSPTDGGVLMANDAAVRMLGWTVEQWRELGRAAMVDPNDPRWPEAVAIRAKDGHFRGLLSARRADGSTVEVDLSSATYSGLDGQPRAYVMFRDVSEYIDQLEAMATVTDVVESMSDAFYTLDSELRITYMNHQAELKLGVASGDVKGMVIWDAFPAARALVEDDVAGVIATGEPTSVEVYFEPADLHAEARLFRLRNGGIGVFFLDVGARKVAEMEREVLLAAEQAARARAEQAQVELRNRATHDELTGLLNRSGLAEAVEDAISGGVTGMTCLLFADLDRFKRVNDSLGHVSGDQVLTSFAARLENLVPAGAVVARFGGDEFVVVLFDTDTEEAEQIAAAVIEASRGAVVVQSPTGVQSTLFVTSSVGIAASNAVPDLDLLLQGADAALYKAKDQGREQFAWFDQPLLEQVMDRVELERDLREGITDQLTLHYQVAFDTISGQPRHVEALARWNHPQRGTVPPSVFIPVAEECGLSEPLGRWVIQQGALQAAAWELAPGVRVYVNVSPRQLDAPNFADDLKRMLREAQCPPERFGIEVTESVLADDTGMSAQVALVRALGVAVAIDDFGTEYSSLARLARTPVDVIKIDRSFVAQSVHDSGFALLSGIVSLAHSLGATVVAEGVETPRELENVVQVGCDAVSGYLLARPVPVQAVQLIPSDHLATSALHAPLAVDIRTSAVAEAEPA